MGEVRAVALTPALSRKTGEGDVQYANPCTIRRHHYHAGNRKVLFITVVASSSPAVDSA